jgi:tetratricopeptide (TPR) repeat protein
MPQKRRVPAPETPEAVSLLPYEITTDPMPERRYQRLPRHVKEAIERLHDLAQRRPREAIPELREWLTQYPQLPLFYNYLSVAYSRAGRRQDAEAVIAENYRRHPDYLFARLNYAEVCLAQGNYARIAEIFAHQFDLRLLYPRRRRFHLSEVANFLGVIGLYFVAIGKRDVAERQYELLKHIAPEYPLTKRLRRTLYPSLFRRLLRGLIGRR